MQQQEGQLAGVRGRTLLWRTWRPQDEPVGLILLVHGAGEHCGRYQHLASRFTERGWVVAALDHHGHGQSEGIPGYIENFHDFLDDLNTLHKQLLAEFPDLPVFLVGHSLGGLIASLYLLDHQDQFCGAVLSGPLIKTPQDPGAVERLAIRVLAALLPRLGMVKLDAAAVSRDPEVVHAYTSDPLVYHGKMRARQLREMFAAMDDIRAGAAAIKLPMLIMHGSADTLTDPAGSAWLHGAISSEDKALQIHTGLYHELFNEPEKDQILGTVIDWCEARLVPS